jgi:hypothetical protein
MERLADRLQENLALMPDLGETANNRVSPLSARAMWICTRTLLKLISLITFWPMLISLVLLLRRKKAIQDWATRSTVP